MNTQQQIPEGYMMNGQGHLVPIERVKEVDKLRDYLVTKCCQQAQQMAEKVDEFKRGCYVDIADFVSLAALDHGVEIGGDKGNITITSYDGRYRICRAKDDQIDFNESITIARELIFSLIHKWSEGSNANIVAIVHKAFETDKDGHLSVAKILALKSVKIDDPDWIGAMQIIDQSIHVMQTKTYLRFYERNAEGKYVQIALGN